MKVRTFVFIVLAIGVLYAAASLFVSNQEVLSRPFHLWGLDIPIGLTLVVFLLMGVAITTLAGITREASLLMERSRSRKASRKSEQIEEEYSKGLAAVVEGREEEALKRFRAVLEWDSKHFNTLLKLGEILRHQGKFVDAIEYHQKAQHIRGDDTRPLYALVEDYEARGDMERARATLARIIGLQKHSVSAWRKLRSLHMKEGNWAKALEAQIQVEKHGGPEVGHERADRDVGLGIRYELACEKMRSAKNKDAVAAFRKILKESPEFIPAHLRLGEALRADGSEGEAIEAWYQGFERTGSPVLLTLLEEHYLQREQPVAAIEALKRCVARASKDTIPRFFLGKLHFRLEMLDEAMSVLTSLERRASYAPNLHYLLGRIHERRKNFREAALEYRKVIKEMELVQLEYHCRRCGETVMEWTDRCSACGTWNAVEVNFREEMSLEELGVSPAPVYTAKN